MYYFTFALLFVLGFLEFSNHLSKYHSIILSKIIVVWLICHDGLRWTTGTDWGPYLEYFNDCISDPSGNFEIGYTFINVLIRSITDNYSIFLIIHAIIIYGLLYFVVMKISTYPLLSIFIFYFIMLPLLGMNRQYIALMLCLLAFYYMTQNKVKLFFCLIALAMTFHVSAFIFLCVYFLNHRFKTKHIVFCLIFALFIGQFKLIDISILSKITFFSETTSDKLNFYQSIATSWELHAINVFLGICKRTLWVIILLIYREKLEKHTTNFNYILNIGCMSLLLYLLVANSPLQNALSRIFVYFGIFEIFTIPLCLRAIKDKIAKSVLILTIFLYGLYNINSGISYYSSDGSIDIFNPYNAIYMKGYRNIRTFMN